MSNKWIYIFFIIKTISINAVDNKVPRVTLFIHGTHLMFSYIGKMLGSKGHIDPVNGLYHLTQCSPEYRYGKTASHIAYCAPERFPEEHFYIFCWSGKLSHEARIEAAQTLDKALNDLFLKYGKKCIITLITHSHGGNVALNLASLASTREYEINTLILLAVPVQKLTSHYVDNILFKNVFSLYSRWDITQIGDLQGLYYNYEYIEEYSEYGTSAHKEEVPWFSDRVFLSKKVKHIEIRQTTVLGHRPIGHIEFLLPHFTYYINSILESAILYDFSSYDSMIFNMNRSYFYTLYGI